MRQVNGFQRSLRLLGGGLLTVAAAIGLWQLASGRPGPVSADRDPEFTPAQHRPFPSIIAQAPSNLASPGEPSESSSQKVARLMNDWRDAIIRKDAEAVETLDRIFAAHAQEFVPALMSSAEGDPEERVRSFSTRVLGKLRPPESVELMRKLLADQSEYVRFNAAWALGELGDRDAASRLRRLQRLDPSANVRRSADESLRRMDGG